MCYLAVFLLGGGLGWLLSGRHYRAAIKDANDTVALLIDRMTPQERFLRGENPFVFLDELEEIQ